MVKQRYIKERTLSYQCTLLLTLRLIVLMPLGGRQPGPGGVVSIFKVRKVIQAEGRSGNLFTDFGYQIVDTVEKVWSSHTALSDTAVDGKPARGLPIHTNTALRATIQFLKQKNNLGQ